MAVRRAGGSSLDYWQTVLGEDIIDAEFTDVTDQKALPKPDEESEPPSPNPR